MAQRGTKAHEDYKAFVSKFEARKTTDDCFTPPLIYEAILDWACSKYKIDQEKIVRPFYPGGDYELFDYPDDCVVLDNPPFSILAKIISFYVEHDIKFFLFAPALTSFSGKSVVMKCNHIFADASITYDNGAIVPTNFVTSFGSNIAETAPDLHKIVKRANEEVLKQTKRHVPRYSYPNEILTAAMMNRYAKYGIEFVVSANNCVPIGKLESQACAGKAIFGGGLLLSQQAAAEKAAAEKAAAEKCPLSVAEKELSESLGR